MFDPDGDQAAADSTRSSTSLGTGSSVNPRTARRLVTALYTSMIIYSAGSTASTPFFFTKTTTNFAGFVALALRPTVCTSFGPS